MAELFGLELRVGLRQLGRSGHLLPLFAQGGGLPTATGAGPGLR
jgi:hypothetical protein